MSGRSYSSPSVFELSIDFLGVCTVASMFVNGDDAEKYEGEAALGSPEAVRVLRRAEDGRTGRLPVFELNGVAK